MKLFSECSGPCETCKTHYLGGCLAGHGDDEYVHATPEWIENIKNDPCKKLLETDPFDYSGDWQRCEERIFNERGKLFDKQIKGTMQATRLKEKFIKKYMRVAREFGTYLNPCYSRQIGAIIVDPVANQVIGLGYNGPPPGTPHTDSEEYLRDYFWPQLTEGEIESIRLMYTLNSDFKTLFIKQYTNSGVCPRRLIKAGPGQRSELCSCGHAERHAITNARGLSSGAEMLCWCGVPCLQCTDAIIQAGIKIVHCLKGQSDYHPKSRWLFEKANVGVIEYDREFFE